MNKSRQLKIAEAAQMACLLEVSSEKPGNVTPTRQFHDLCYTNFLHSAVILGDCVRQNCHKSVGEIILACVKQCSKHAGTNVNLGIILLLAPLASVYYHKGNVGPGSIKTALNTLTVKDAEQVYEAIRIADPGGLGKVEQHDVRKKPKITLLRAMKLAADRDWIAQEYANGFGITFDVGAPALKENLEAGLTIRESIVQTFLKILYLYPDTHIARRVSPETALEVSEKAGAVLKKGGLTKPAGRRAVYDFDHYLRSESNSLNPGATADLVASSLFVHFIENGYKPLHSCAK